MTPKEAIMSAEVEFLPGVPVRPTARGAEAILDALGDAGFHISKLRLAETGDCLADLVARNLAPEHREELRRTIKAEYDRVANEQVAVLEVSRSDQEILSEALEDLGIMMSYSGSGSGEKVETINKLAKRIRSIQPPT